MKKLILLLSLSLLINSSFGQIDSSLTRKMNYQSQIDSLKEIISKKDKENIILKNLILLETKLLDYLAICQELNYSQGKKLKGGTHGVMRLKTI